jgi:hypothetical protein
MQAIVTKYIGPSNVKGSRIKATSASGVSAFSDYKSEYDTERNHREAIRKLCHKLGWHGHMVLGSTKVGYVAVFVDEPVINQSFIVP